MDGRSAAGASIGGALGAFGGGLASIGIPSDSIVQYETLVKEGKLIVVVQGTRTEVERARHLLHTHAKATTVHAGSAVPARQARYGKPRVQPGAVDREMLLLLPAYKGSDCGTRICLRDDVPKGSPSVIADCTSQFGTPRLSQEGNPL